MPPTGGVPGTTEPDDRIERPTLLAEAVTLWELHDELTLHVLGLDSEDEFPATVHDFVQAVAERLTGSAAAPGADPAPARPVCEEVPDGRRVAFWRRRRGLTRQELARRVGRSDAWVAAVEEGLDRVPSAACARELAAALQIDVPLLMGRDPHPQPLPTGDPVGDNLERIREFLERCDALGPAPDTVAPSLAAIAVGLRDAWRCYRQAEYGSLTGALPRLLQDAVVSDGARAGGPDGPEAARLLSQAYQVTAAVLRKLGEYQLSWLTADRAIEAAGRGRDPLLTAAASRFAAATMLAMGRTTPALNLSMTATTSLPTQQRPHHTQLVVEGTLLLQGAAAAARMADTVTIGTLLASADSVAARLEQDTGRYWTRFGRTVTELSRASIAVELGDGAEAITIHRRLQQALPSLPREQHAGHYLTLARAYLQTGATEEAAEALATSTRLAPAERRNPLHQALRHQIQAA
ncbi:helix-turn-helix domain-containing protein [Actinoplanes sp. CA-252034]|uniref:helix-turn-helix domain-containing protein n=1 Tax=Actinoplanes sp. CA-252034 TaxID=3239906 RepID=UPI003D9914CA